MGLLRNPPRMLRLPQSGRLANDLLHTRLEKSDYYEAATTPGLWCHKWCPIKFVLIIDDFGIEYVGKEHVLHLLKSLDMDYEITTDWEGKKFRHRPCLELSCLACQ